MSSTKSGQRRSSNLLESNLMHIVANQNYTCLMNLRNRQSADNAHCRHYFNCRPLAKGSKPRFLWTYSHIIPHAHRVISSHSESYYLDGSTQPFEAQQHGYITRITPSSRDLFIYHIFEWFFSHVNETLRWGRRQWTGSGQPSSSVLAVIHGVFGIGRKRREDNASQKTCEESPARQRLWIRICHKVFLSLTMDTIFAGDYGSLQALHGSHSRSKHRWGRSELSSYLVKSGVTGFNSGFSSGVFWVNAVYLGWSSLGIGLIPGTMVVRDEASNAHIPDKF